MKTTIAALAVILIMTGSSLAAAVGIQEWNGHQVLRIDGTIEPGDVERIAQKLPQADKMPYGTPVVLLSSQGGPVNEALMISKLFDRSPVHTVIPDGAKCASACASILFIAGKYRTMEDGAALGQHSCSVNGVKHELCNEILSEHAVNHGVSHGSVAAFVSYVEPEDILWFSRADAEGWGITRYPGEDMSGFEKSEPRVFRMITGKEPEAQARWRINFKGKGFEAFVRTVSDYEREMQLKMFCVESIKGKLFLAMEITGPAKAVQDSVLGAAIWTDQTKWETRKPIIHQLDDNMTELFVEIPEKEIRRFLTKTKKLRFTVILREPYQPMVADTWLDESRKVLLFAANNCVQE